MAQPSDHINVALAAVLRGAYAKAGLNREDIAARSGLSLASINRYMNSSVDMPSRAFQRIAEAIGRRADELYAEALRDAEQMSQEAERMSEGASNNQHPREWSVDELEARRQNRSLRSAANPRSAESDTDEPPEG